MSFEEYYYALKHAQPIKTDEVKHPIRTALIKADARGLYSHAQAVLDQLEDEIFPDTCTELLTDWERALAIVPPSGATLAERRDACWSKWGGGLGTSTRDLRRSLAPLLNPTLAFCDLFDRTAGDLSWRWTTYPGNGECVEDGGGHMLVQVANTVNGDWGHAPFALVATVDKDDPVTVEADVTTLTLNTDTFTGLVLWRDVDNGILLGSCNVGGTPCLRVDRIDEGVITETVWSGTAVSAPYTIKVRADATTVSLWIDDVLKWSGDQGFVTTRAVGVYARNKSSSFNAVGIEIEEFKYWHDKPENNVELIERPASIVPDDFQELIFGAFVHREPTDPGSYNLAEAQRTLDRMKLAHTVITVGESDFFLCDDPYSLTDRDVLGDD